jgi:hypothetical protein
MMKRRMTNFFWGVGLSLVLALASTSALAAPDRVVLTGPTTILKDGLGAFTLTTKNSAGNVDPVSENTTFNLTSTTSGTGAFYSDAAGTTPLPSSQVTINNGQSTATVYYRDNTFGMPILTATRTSGQALTAGTKQIMVKGNNALSLDGTDDYVDCGNSASVQITGTKLTIEAWIKPTAFSGWLWENTIVDKHGEANLGYVLRCGGTGILQFNFGNGGGWHAATSPENALTINEWQHVAGVYDGTTQKIYVNGKEVGTIGETANIANNPDINLRLGNGQLFEDRLFKGEIDEVRIWKSARSVAEIRANMHRQLQGNEADLVAYYKMDIGTGTTAYDSGPNGNDGTLTDGPTWQTSGAMSGPGNALDFDGSDYVQIPGSSTLTSGTFSVEFWMKMTGQTTWGGIIDHGAYDAEGDRHNWQFLTYDGQWKIIFGITKNVAGNWSELTADVTENKWHHVAGLYDGSTMSLYLDGVLVGTQTTTIRTGDKPIVIGKRVDADQYFNGQLDEIRVWKIARTAAQIRDNMANSLQGDEPGLMAYYRMDQQAVAGQTTLYDQTLNGNDGTLTNMDPATDWVASTAFNTWIGSESTAWGTAENWSRAAAPVATDNVGIPDYSNTGYPAGNAPTISGAPTVNHFVLAAGAGPTLYSGLTVNGNLIVEADLDLNGQTVELGSSGYLIEDTGRIFGTTGSIFTTRSINAPSSENVAGLGAVLTTGSNLGSTTITRGHSAVSEASGLPKSIYRYYEIEPTNNSGLGATLKFYYHTDELNNIPEEDLALFRYDSGKEKWQCNATTQTRNADENWVQQTGIDAFSRWTLGDENDPTLVNLVSFTAKGLEDSVKIGWEIASEIDNAGFHLWRGQRTDRFYARITDAMIPAEGGPSWGAKYAYEDRDVEPGTTYVYQLQDIDTAGRSNFHGPASAWAGVANIQAGGGDKAATATEEEPVSVKVAIQAGDHAGTPVEYWVAVNTPFGWYSYGAQGWNPGIAPAAVGPLADVAPLETLNFPLPPGWYTFYLAVDDQINGQPDLTWVDAVEVEVE